MSDGTVYPIPNRYLISVPGREFMIASELAKRDEGRFVAKRTKRLRTDDVAEIVPLTFNPSEAA